MRGDVVGRRAKKSAFEATKGGGGSRLLREGGSITECERRGMEVKVIEKAEKNEKSVI